MNKIDWNFNSPNEDHVRLWHHFDFIFRHLTLVYGKLHSWIKFIEILTLLAKAMWVYAIILILFFVIRISYFHHLWIRCSKQLKLNLLWLSLGCLPYNKNVDILV